MLQSHVLMCMTAFWPHVLWTFSSLSLLACVPITQAYSARLSIQTVPPPHLMCLPDVSFPGTQNKHGWPMACASVEAGARQTETRDLYSQEFLKCKFLNCFFRALQSCALWTSTDEVSWFSVSGLCSQWDEVGTEGSRQEQFLSSPRWALHPELGAGDLCHVSLLWSVFGEGFCKSEC